MTNNLVSVRRLIHLLSGSLLVAAFAGPTAADEWVPGVSMAQAVGRVMGSARAISDQTVFGYDDGTCIMAAFLRPGADVGLTRPLTMGQEYVILGGGDRDVDDLDIEIVDSNGRVVASNVLNDAAPTVRFVAPWTGSYVIRQRLCKARTSSFCVVAVLRAGGFKVPVANLMNTTTNLIEFCNRVDRNRKETVVFQDADNQWAIYGSVLGNREQMTITNLALGEGRRVVLAAGDGNARDIDLFVLDEQGTVKVQDVERDATPVADITVGASVRAGVRVTNVDSNGLSLILAAVLRVEDRRNQEPSIRNEWRPGRFMRQSMTELLTKAAQVVNGGKFGFSETAYLGAFLQPGGFSFLTTTLNQGQTYAFIGAGNQEARDLDILIEDAAGAVVAQDTKDNATPIVQFTPDRTQRFTLKLKLHAAAAPCFCGMVWLRENGWQVPVLNLDAAMSNMLARCESVAAERPARFLEVPGEWAVVGTIIEQGKSSTFSDIRLGAGRRAMTAGGDTVARDIDLEVYEDLPKFPPILDKDEKDNAAPLVQCTASPLKRYGLVIKNAASQGGTMIMTALLDLD